MTHPEGTESKDSLGQYVHTPDAGHTKKGQHSRDGHIHKRYTADNFIWRTVKSIVHLWRSIIVL